MCGRYAFIPKNDVYKTEPNYNVAPGMVMPVIVEEKPLKVDRMKWGLVPSWAHDPKIAYSTINARAEEIEKKPAYRSAFKSRRCLVPASGFYEWKKVIDAGRIVKIPYWIRLKNEDLFNFAGIYENGTFSIVTTTANEMMKYIHDRMPVILGKEQEEVWIENSKYDLQELKKLMLPYPSEEMIANRISPRVNNPENNDNKLTEPVY